MVKDGKTPLYTTGLCQPSFISLQCYFRLVSTYAWSSSGERMYQGEIPHVFKNVSTNYWQNWDLKISKNNTVHKIEEESIFPRGMPLILGHFVFWRLDQYVFSKVRNKLRTGASSYSRRTESSAVFCSKPVLWWNCTICFLCLYSRISQTVRQSMHIRKIPHNISCDWCIVIY